MSWFQVGEGLFISTLLCSLEVFVSFAPITQITNYYSFIMSLDIWQDEFLCLILWSLGLPLPLVGPWFSLIIIRISLSNSTKKILRYYWDFGEFRDKFGKNWHIYGIEFSCPLAEYLFPSIWILFNALIECFILFSIKLLDNFS